MTDAIHAASPPDSAVPASPTCPLCHTLDDSVTSHALAEGASWRCARCGQMWTAARLATAAAYATR